MLSTIKFSQTIKFFYAFESFEFSPLQHNNLTFPFIATDDPQAPTEIDYEYWGKLNHKLRI